VSELRISMRPLSAMQEYVEYVRQAREAPAR
jgi:hypothetical protein